MPRKNYYEIFRIFPPVDLQQLQHAYKQLIFEYHPDRNPDRPDWALERTMEVVEAYNVLSDPARREIYDFQVKNDIRREPGDMAGKKGLLQKMMRSKEETQAEEHFRRGVELFEDKDQWNQVQHEWLQAVRLVPSFVNAHYNLGILCAYQGKHQDALNCLARVLKLCPQDAEAKRAKNAVMGFLYGKKV